MLTGVETAGLVLGSIPLLVSALEHYAEGVNTIERWWRFERELSTIRRLLVAEQAVFQGTCERLLDGLVPGTELDHLIDNPGGPGWDAKLDAGLQQRLGRSYASFNECVEYMRDVIDALRDQLDLDPEGKPVWAQGPSFQKQLKKIKFSILRSRYQESLQALAKNNDILSTLLNQSLELEPLRRRRSNVAGIHDMIRINASMMYQGMTKRWSCKCHDAHRVRLQLDARPRNHSQGKGKLMSFNLVFHTRKTIDEGWIEQPTCIFLTEHMPPQLQTTSISNQVVQSSLSPLPEKKKSLPMLRSIFAKKSKAKLSSASVNFADASSSTVKGSHTTSIQEDGPEIDDFCEMFSRLSAPFEHGQSIGHFTCETESTFTLSASSLTTGALEYSDLDAFTQSAFTHSKRGFHISRGDRYGLALTIASSILQLSSTPWLPEAWDKPDIQVLLEQQNGKAGDEKLPSDYSKRLYVEKSFPVCYDNQASPAANVFPGLRNQALFRLGIVLIELCLGDTLESLRTSEDPLDRDGKSNILTEWATATRLIHDVSREAGNRYGDAVRRCIYCDFDQRSTSLENSAFRQAVYDGIIVPLEDIYEDYNQAFTA